VVHIVGYIRWKYGEAMVVNDLGNGQVISATIRGPRLERPCFSVRDTSESGGDDQITD
jgi:hypothetical protein